MYKKDYQDQKELLFDFLDKFDRKVPNPDQDQLRVRGCILKVIGSYESLVRSA